MLGLTLEWLESQGGVPGMERIKHGKAQMLYDTLDNSKLLHCVAEPGSRSDMNVTFRSDSDEMDAKFVAAATEAGFHNLKGHRKVGGDARLHLQRHAGRRRGKAVRLHSEVRSGTLRKGGLKYVSRTSHE